jgi:hypothetical protein
MKIGKRFLVVLGNKFPFLQVLTGEEIFEHAFVEASNDTIRRAKSSVEELSKEYAEAETNGDRATCVVIEHILSTRLLRIQANTALIATGITVCAMLASTILGYYLGGGTNFPCAR